MDGHWQRVCYISWNIVTLWQCKWRITYSIMCRVPCVECTITWVLQNIHIDINSEIKVFHSLCLKEGCDALNKNDWLIMVFNVVSALC